MEEMNNAGTSRRRIVLKISGEGFCPAHERGIVMDSVNRLASQIAEVAASGIEMAIVMGGGNILRGAAFKAANSSIQEATAHYMGMLATLINGLALQDAVEALGQPTRLMTTVKADSVAEPYIRRRADHHLEKGRVVIIAGGTGLPFVTVKLAMSLDGKICDERGEAKWINPFRPNADAEFDSALPYELAVLKHYVQGQLEKVVRRNPDEIKAQVLLELLQAVHATDPTKVPGDSILRETIGGSQLDY